MAREACAAGHALPGPALPTAASRPAQNQAHRARPLATGHAARLLHCYERSAGQDSTSKFLGQKGHATSMAQRSAMVN
jgi:hypothetical protein